MDVTVYNDNSNMYVVAYKNGQGAIIIYVVVIAQNGDISVQNVTKKQSDILQATTAASVTNLSYSSSTPSLSISTSGGSLAAVSGEA